MSEEALPTRRNRKGDSLTLETSDWLLAIRASKLLIFDSFHSESEKSRCRISVEWLELSLFGYQINEKRKYILSKKEQWFIESLDVDVTQSVEISNVTHLISSLF